MAPNNDLLILKIKNKKNNHFLSASFLDGYLLLSKSLYNKQIKDLKVKLTGILVNILKQLRIMKISIKFIHLFIGNIESNLIQYLFAFFKTWNINITFLKYNVTIPHNGCRRSHKSRKRQKGRRKMTEII